MEHIKERDVQDDENGSDATQFKIASNDGYRPEDEKVGRFRPK
jgi:hypothetical protein